MTQKKAAATATAPAPDPPADEEERGLVHFYNYLQAQTHLIKN